MVSPSQLDLAAPHSSCTLPKALSPHVTCSQLPQDAFQASRTLPEFGSAQSHHSVLIERENQS